MNLFDDKMKTVMMNRKTYDYLFSENKLNFGKPLDQVMSFGPILPPPLKSILKKLYSEAHQTVQVFGVTPPYPICCQLRYELSEGIRIKWKNIGVHTTAAVFKYFLRSLPKCLLFPDYYFEWIDIKLDLTSSLVHSNAKRLISKLPESYRVLLKHLLIILRRICQAVPITLSTPIIIGHFIGPYVLWNPQLGFCAFPSQKEHLQLAKIVKYLIIHLDSIFHNVYIEQILPIGNKKYDPFNMANFHYSKFVYQTPEIYLKKIEQNASSTFSSYLTMEDSCIDSLNFSDNTNNTNVLEEYKDIQTNSDTLKLFKNRNWQNSMRVSYKLISDEKSNKKRKNKSKEKYEAKQKYPKSKTWCLNRRKLLEEKISLPSWLYHFENWKMDSDVLPSWISHSNFTMNMNDLTRITEIKSNYSRKLIFEMEEKNEFRKYKRIFSNFDDLRKLIEDLF